MNTVRFVIITDLLRAFGFRLAGIEAIAVEDSKSAQEQLVKLIRRGDVGVVGLNESFLAELDPTFRRRVEDQKIPMLIPIPRGDMETARSLRAEHIAESVRRIIGWRISFGETGSKT